MKKHQFHSSKCQQIKVCEKLIYKPSFPQRNLYCVKENSMREQGNISWVTFLKDNSWL